MKMRKLAAVILSAMMLLSVVACGDQDKPAEEESKNKIENGTYEGTGEGRGGEIKIETTIEDDQIVKIEVVSQNETPGYETAMENLTKSIITENKTDQDVISGSTLTSNGFLEAVNSSLTAAGATADMLKKVDSGSEKAEKEEKTATHDVVIVGAGGAGLAAAVEAKMAGADVVVLEKMPMAGGNTLISGAEYAAPVNWIQEKEGIEDSKELFVDDVMKGGDQKSKVELVQVLADHATEGAEWLRDEVGVIWEEDMMFFGGHSVKRSLIPLGASGREIITKLVAKAKDLEIPIMYETKATELMMDEEGNIIGVKAEGIEANYEFTTNKGVVIASGGFGSNLEMRVKYNPEIDDSILSTNTVGSTGDGITLAEGVGGALIGMEYIQTYPICDPLTGTLLYFDDSRLYGHTVIVNKEGKRFVEELGRRDEMSMAIKAQTGHVCYEVLDQNGFVESKLQENHGPEIEYLYANDLLVKADSLEEAAAFFDINADALKETIEAYNGYVKDGNDPEFNKRSLPSTLEKAPYYILKASPAVHHTMGGIEINTEAQVLNAEGQVIKGLYAAGEVTGGIQGANRLGSNALADITVFGRIAGKNVAK